MTATVVTFVVGLGILLACVGVKAYEMYKELTEIEEPEPGKPYWYGP